MRKLPIILLMLTALSNPCFANLSHQEIISINTTENKTPKANAINEIRDRIKNKYQIDIKLNAEQKYLEKNELEALELGLTNIIILNSNILSNKYKLKDFDIFEIPFIFNGLKEFNKFNNSLVSEELLKKINDKNKNLYGLTFWAKNYKHVQSSIEIKNYENLKNKSFNLPATEINNSIALTINPENSKRLVLDETNSYKLNNTMYSTMLSLNEFEKYKMSDKNKNILLTYHGFDIDIILINKRWFNKLSTEVQAGIIDIIKKVGEDEQKNILIEDQKLINNLKSKGVIINPISFEDRALFKKEMAPVHRYYYNYINKDLLIKIYNLFK